MNAPTLEERLSAAISSVGQSDFQIHLADWIHSSVAYDNIAVLAYFQGRRPELLMTRSRTPAVHANIETQYLTGDYLLDPFHELHITEAPRGAYRLSDIAPDRFQRNRYFIEYYNKTRMLDEIAFVSYPAQGVSIHVCLGRDSSSNTRFNSRSIKIASKIAPIVASLAESHWKFLESNGTDPEEYKINQLSNSLRNQTSIRLTPRQTQVALLMLQCYSSEAIAIKLGISPQTVRVFRKQIYKRCSISSQGELFNLLLPMLRH